ncbi:hypothetical protein K505DRAFT_257600, partial [Melanomma pulvis-pyrius CBS 109.77]
YGDCLSSDGTILLDGGPAEGVWYSMPCLDLSSANWKPDIFALRSAIYFMVTGGTPFPELDTWRDRS